MDGATSSDRARAPSVPLSGITSHGLKGSDKMTTPRPPPEGGRSWFVAVGHRPRTGGRANVLWAEGGEAEMHREQFSEEVLIEGRGIVTL